MFNVYAMLMIMPKCSLWYSSFHQRLSCKISLGVVGEMYVNIFAIAFHAWVMWCQTLDPPFVENYGGNNHKEEGFHGPWHEGCNFVRRCLMIIKRFDLPRNKAQITHLLMRAFMKSYGEVRLRPSTFLGIVQSTQSTHILAVFSDPYQR